MINLLEPNEGHIIEQLEAIQRQAEQNPEFSEGAYVSDGTRKMRFFMRNYSFQWDDILKEILRSEVIRDTFKQDALSLAPDIS